MKKLVLSLMLLTVIFCSVLCFIPAEAGEQPLRVLAWPGYADPDIVKTFEQRTGARVEVTFVGTDLELWTKLSRNNGRDFDVFAVNTAELQRYIAKGLVSGIPVQEISNRSKQLPRFRDLNSIRGIVHNGTVYAIPYTYSEMGLIYDRQQLKKAPESITALWDKQYRGKVIAYNAGVHNFSLAAQTLRLSSPFSIPPADIPAVVDRLIALRRNVTGFYTQPEESVAMFKNRKAALMFANFGTQQVQLLKKAGVDAGYALPKEGALAWLDCWAITREAKNKKLAAAWINYLLDDLPGKALTSRQGLANTTAESPSITPEKLILWLEPVEDEARRDQLWGRIVSGSSAAKVLAP
ncbi:extracellular solute-binding protein [Trichlorobacter ammonificans]|uniref:extracellular solute-binding protein n=1 Tax=Trichlorobacter ammonificans TaxID=2916410 RepID=UPI00273799D0|nr:extracellular solute-binding protein [Trichlorobacter ammonificans]